MSVVVTVVVKCVSGVLVCVHSCVCGECVRCCCNVFHIGCVSVCLLLLLTTREQHISLCFLGLVMFGDDLRYSNLGPEVQR